MFKCLQYDRFHTSSWVNITIHRFWNWAIFLHKKNENWMHFHKVQNHTPYNFRHSEPMLCHHLNPVDEKLGEQRNKTKERKKMRKSRRKSRSISRYTPAGCGYWNDDHDGPFLNQPEIKRMKEIEHKQKNTACLRLC